MNKLLILFILLGTGITVSGHNSVVADSMTHTPLPNASVYDRHGTFIGISDRHGLLPAISSKCYPITVSYLGFFDKLITLAGSDTIFMQEAISELPEVLVQTGRHRVLHMLAYVREYSSMSTYTDTVFLFREKMVDFMIPSVDRANFRGWLTPRVLTSRSYCRFTDSNGLDSVSDACRHHFSYSDWMGVISKAYLPPDTAATDAQAHEYAPGVVAARGDSGISLSINVLADTVNRSWAPYFTGFFHKDLDLEKFDVSYHYRDCRGDYVHAEDLTCYYFNIESRGRGREMFRFNRTNEPVFVSTRAEVYILDKEYISLKEARKWEKQNLDTHKIGIYEPMEAPELPTSTLQLISRVNDVDKISSRLDYVPDHRLVAKYNGRLNFKVGQRALMLLKQISGITLYKSRSNFNDNWNNFRKERILNNSQNK